MDTLDTKYTLGPMQLSRLQYYNDANYRYFNPCENERWRYCNNSEYLSKCEEAGEIAWFFDDTLCEIYTLLERSYPDYIVEGLYFKDYENKYKNNNLKQSVTTQQRFEGLGVRHKDASFYNAIVVSHEEENSLGAMTTRWYVASPFTKRDRRHSLFITPVAITDSNSIKTNCAKKAVKHIMSLPHLTFSHLLSATFNQRELTEEVKSIQAADLMEYKTKASEMFYDIGRLCGRNNVPHFIEFTNAMAQLLNGNAEVDIAETKLPEAQEVVRKYLEETKDLAAYVEESSRQTHLYVAQVNVDSPTYCFGTTTGKMMHSTIEHLGAHKKFDSPSQMPDIVRSKLAAIEINKENLVEGDYWNYLPNIGASPCRAGNKLFLRVIFLTHEEMGDIFT